MRRARSPAGKNCQVSSAAAAGLYRSNRSLATCGSCEIRRAKFGLLAFCIRGRKSPRNLCATMTTMQTFRKADCERGGSSANDACRSTIKSLIKHDLKVFASPRVHVLDLVESPRVFRQGGDRGAGGLLMHRPIRMSNESSDFRKLVSTGYQPIRNRQVFDGQSSD